MPPKSELLQRAYSVTTPDEVRDLYRDWAASYDQDLTGTELQYVAPIEAVKVFKNHFDDAEARVLDVGCGTGLSGLALAKAGFQSIDGLDLSADMLRQARAKGVYGELFEADLTKRLDLDSDSYDAALSVGTFTHGHVGPDGLDELVRAVRPDGIVCFTVNEGVYVDYGFEAKFQAMETAGQCRLIDVVEADYLKGEGIRSKVVSLGVI